MIGFWNWMAILSLNLFLLNLLPIPALDGSHILFALVEWARGGKKVPPEKEAIVHAIGFATLMGLMILVSVSDLLNALNGTSVLKGG
jgi:regulator of sigma E protease